MTESLKSFSVQGNAMIGDDHEVRRLGLGLVFILLFLLAIPFGGLIGLAALTVLAFVALVRVSWDALRPTSEKATFKCGDCQYHHPSIGSAAWCLLTKQLAIPRGPACRKMRLKGSDR
jgi:hypothetical protein